MSREIGCEESPFGALLRHYRGVRGLTQEELAERSGLHVQEVSMLERGVRRAPRSTTVEFLAEALNLKAHEREAFLAAAANSATRTQVGEMMPPALADLTGAESLLASMPTDAAPPRGALPAGSRMPLAPNPLFVGRGDGLLEVAKALRGGGSTVALGQVVASTGLGGLGKTQLAVELVHRCGRFFAGGVFWLSFASADEIPLQIAACAGPGFEARSMEERVQRVMDAWQSAMPRLLVFDNCEEETLLDTWRPTSGGCRVLVTSRRSHWSPTLGVIDVPLDLLPRTDSVELLRRYRPGPAPDDADLDALAAEVGDLPLALHLAGSYLHAYRAEVSLRDYLSELRSSDVVDHASLLGAGLQATPNPTRHIQSVAQTFALCLSRLDREREVDRVAIALLARMAWMAPGEPVPRDLLGRTLEGVDPLLRADGLRRLGAVGLVEEGDGWVRLHRLLVHFVRQARLDSGAPSTVHRLLIECGDAAAHDDLSGLALAAVVPHLVDATSRSSSEDPSLAELCTATGQAFQHLGDLPAARPWLERALNIRESAEGSDHPRTAASLNNLARLLSDQGELAAARLLFERALTIRERVLGPHHPDTVEGLDDLGMLLWTQGEVAAAVATHQRALARRVQLHGTNHPMTALSLTNLAIALSLQGDLSAAKPLFERALTIRECMLGADHPLTALSLNNMGYLLRRQVEHVAAMPLLQRALAIQARVRGHEHPEVAYTLNNLALVFQAQGDWAAARAHFERALGIRERRLGTDHPLTALIVNNLAILLQAQGDPAAARPLFERALAIRERALGPDHPDTVATRRALAELAGQEGDGLVAGG
jgi:tetratricopeptide (TPR) repeat protein/transcriptional regulator with XRE-family HTH domain